jgi:hypothetical protein
MHATGNFDDHAAGAVVRGFGDQGGELHVCSEIVLRGQQAPVRRETCGGGGSESRV